MAFTYIFFWVAAWQCDFFALSNICGNIDLIATATSAHATLLYIRYIRATTITRSESDKSAGMLSYDRVLFE